MHIERKVCCLTPGIRGPYTAVPSIEVVVLITHPLHAYGQ